MPWAAVGAIGGALISADAANSASSAAEQQNALNIAAQERWNKLVDPFSAGGNRAQYVSQLNDLMQGGYQGLEQDPMYQWMRKQGVDQVQRGMSRTGGLGSGAEAIALQNQGFGLGMDFFNQQYARLADLSGASRGGGSVAMGQSPGSAFNQQLSVGQSNMNAFGGIMGGLQSLFGQGAGTNTQQSTIYSGNYNPNSYNTYDPNPNGYNP